MKSSHEESPFNALPPIVVALALVIFGVELIFQAGARGFIGGPQAVGWRLDGDSELRLFRHGSGLDDRNRAAGRWSISCGS